MKKELTLPAIVENIETVTDFVNEYLDEVGCSMKAQMQIAIAIDEIVSNIAFYAYAPGTGVVRVSMEQDADSVKIVFADHGIEYNPLGKADPNVSLLAEERQIGGMGIFMVKKLMDDISYKYEDGCNILTIWKKI